MADGASVVPNDLRPILERLGRERDALSRRFRAAQPFEHLVIDDFLDPAFCRRLCEDFRPCDPSRSGPEYGGLFGLSPDEIRGWGPAYRRLDALLRQESLREALGFIVGRPRLLFDEGYAGRGPSAYPHGQSLTPHVDFNRHPKTGWLRTLNAILYLNAEWKSDWGGHLKLYAAKSGRFEPRVVKTIEPVINRLVLLDTGGSSWHGISPVDLPEERRGLSRRAFLVSYWSDDRSVAKHPSLWAGQAQYG